MLRFRPLRPIAAVLFLMALGPLPAGAQAHFFPTTIATVPNALVTLTSCTVDDGPKSSVVLRNRTVHKLRDVRVRFAYADADGRNIGTKIQDMEMKSPIASGDSSEIGHGIGSPTLAPLRAVADITCRLEYATFSGGKTWTYGHPWKEKLLPLKSDQ